VAELSVNTSSGADLELLTAANGDRRAATDQAYDDGRLAGGLEQLRGGTAERWPLEQEMVELRKRLATSEGELTVTREQLATERATHRDAVEALLLQLSAAQQRLAELDATNRRPGKKRFERRS
jgi:hypothetical protein